MSTIDKSRRGRTQPDPAVPETSITKTYDAVPNEDSGRDAKLRQFEVTVWPLERFRPYSNNPRNNDAAVGRMVGSIKEFGFKLPVLALSGGEVVDGHLRLKAAQELGLREIPVLLRDEWTSAQVKAFRLLVNRSATWAEWDEARLAVEFQTLQAMDFHLDLTGFSTSEIATCLAQQPTALSIADEDSAPAALVDPVSRIGDVWILGKHRLACGDATAGDAVGRLMGNEKADLIFIDPPYNVNYGGKNSASESRARSRKRPRLGGGKATESILNDNLPEAEFLLFCKQLFGALHTNAKRGAVAYVCCSDKGMPQFRQAFEESGFHWSCNIVWAKGHFTLSRADYQPQHEPIMYGWTAGERHHWCGSRDQGTVWAFPKPQANDLHPTQKPVALIERAIENSSRAGEIVIDLCAGSGSTLIACEKTGRRGRLMEIDPRYVDVTVERWEQFSGGSAVRERDGRKFKTIPADGKLRKAA